jgi:uncharacterized protein YndB with AHSA1/START domain
MGHVQYSEQIKATPEKIWAVIADVVRLPEWAYKKGRFPYPVEGKYGSDQKEGVGVIWIGVATDGQVARQTITAWEPPRKLVYELQEMEHAPLQMSQTNTLDLEPVGEMTKVTWSVDWKLTSGFSLNSLLIWFTGNGAFEEMIAGSLENLKELIEKEANQPDPASTPEADQAGGSVHHDKTA